MRDKTPETQDAVTLKSPLARGVKRRLAKCNENVNAV
jgi:hypothetical protein